MIYKRIDKIDYKDSRRFCLLKILRAHIQTGIPTGPRAMNVSKPLPASDRDRLNGFSRDPGGAATTGQQ
eukprot:11214616-Lingulodinium_polyedra.AAC.1